LRKPLIILTGPTAVGKTALSIKLAQHIDGEIISADSMQVYKGMDIGTAKVMPDEMEGVPHYLIDEFQPDEEFSVHTFQQRSKKHMETIYAKHKKPILVGGTGFYIQSVLYDIEFSNTSSADPYREVLTKLASDKGPLYLHDQLSKVDPQSALKIHPNNVKRVIRALEYYHQTQQPISQHNEEQEEKESPYNYAYFVLTMERDMLYKRINKRVDIMMAQGLVEEVKRLRDQGYSKDLVSMKGIGYKEIIDYLDGKYSLDEAIYILKRDTRHFAKRQLTWFKREPNVKWINVSEYDYNLEQVLNKILKDIEEIGII
jgi:tRNA dimethylallyltransferase